MHEPSHPTDVERSDADARLIASIALGVALFLISAPFLVVLSFPGAQRVGRIPTDLPQPPVPQLQVTPQADLDRLRSAEREQLANFGWVDRDQGIVHIPIDRAMELIVERGLNDWPGRTTAAPR